ncbi:uncharacterized protein EI90DRAFT_3032566 [Cantharellus anzutake]|uniref:uncharacterized protein n=1 Tax=Cantharellus anzutake TaxID=1750568 RepID=UPI001905CB0A|nr:uncharacterized protein EI90DRAFT_3032566 [Cantharellus anzutake]KAF8342239.1 hypothetical protein EI90DRAFT_3032566 [Cantharellus anzutake]
MFDNSLWLHHDGAGAMNAVHLEHRSFPSIHSSPQSLLSLIEFHASQVAKYRELYKSSQVELTLERAAKRKSEDEVDRERAMRRKLEDQVWEMKTNEKSSF